MARTSSTRLALWAILIAATPLLASAAGDVNYGLSMFAKAGKGVCWIEKLHKLPAKAEPINDEGVNWGTCEMNMKWDSNEWENQYKFQADFQRENGNDPDTMVDFLTESAMGNLKDNMKQKFDQLNPAYRSSCEKFVDNENQAPNKDFSSTLKDQAQYPFKGLAHCILEVAERRNGKTEMAALKSRWTSPKSFHQAIIDRENEHRARHGTPALKLDSELSTRAQRWAEKLAAAGYCRMEHMSDVEPASPDLQYKGGKTGENIHQNGYKDGDDADTGMGAANNWYSEIKDYPWPQFKGTARGVIGHFTASVWKSTQLAGYGIARSPGCDKVLVVARYSPGGNMQRPPSYSDYKENVLPPVI